MAALVFVSVFCVLLGGLIGAMRDLGPRLLGAIRTFALCAVLGVVALHLIPEALDELGVWGVLLAILGFLAPTLVERGSPHATGHVKSADVGFAGLVVHQLSDGLALWATAGGELPTVDVALALFAHSTPLAALLFLRFEALRGRRAAMLRVLGLALASALGVGFGSSATSFAPGAWVPATGALAAGLLLHLFAHDLTVDTPSSKRQRWLDLFSAAVGVSLSVVGLNAHARVEPEAAELAYALRTALLDLTVETAPMLLLGLSVSAFVQTLGLRIPARFIHGGTPFTQAVRGAAIGAPLPVCACGVLPLAESLAARGAGGALVVSFLLMTPELGVDAFLLTARMFGLPFALTRLIGAALLSILAAYVLARVSSKLGAAGTTELSSDHGHGSFSHRFIHTFDDLLHHTGPWIALGILAAAYVQVVVPQAALARSRPGVDVLIVSALAIPSYVCAASATPLGAVLLSKGMSMGAVLAGLVLGPATNVATLSFLSRVYGRSAAVSAIGALVIGTWLLAFSVNTWFPASALRVAPVFASQSHSMFQILFALLLSLLLLRSMWRTGARAWIASLASTAHVHGHVRAVDARN